MDRRAPFGSKAASDLPEDDGRPDFALGDVVGRWDAPVLQEDEEFGPPCFRLSLQNSSGGMSSANSEQPVETPFGFGVILAQRAVFQLVSPSSYPDGPEQEIAQPGGKDRIAAIDGILNIAQHMGEADLVRTGEVLLTSVAVGYPDVRTMLAQHLFGDCFRPAGGDLVQDGGFRDEGPLPDCGPVDPGRGFVRGNDCRLAQRFADRLARGLQWPGLALEAVGNRTLGDRQAEHFQHQPRQPLETDVVAVVQIQQKRLDAGAERCARRHPLRRGGLEPSPAAAASPAQQFDSRRVGHYGGDIDVIVAMAHALGLAGYIDPAFVAGARRHLHRLVGVLCQMS